MVSFLLLLEVHIPLLGVGSSDIREIDAQPAMSDNGAEVVNLSAPQQWHTTSDLTGRPGPVTFRNGGSPLAAATTVVVAELPGGRRTRTTIDCCSCSSSFGDGGPTVGNSRHKHFTEGDQRLYSSTVYRSLGRSQREARDVVNGGGTGSRGIYLFMDR